MSAVTGSGRVVALGGGRSSGHRPSAARVEGERGGTVAVLDAPVDGRRARTGVLPDVSVGGERGAGTVVVLGVVAVVLLLGLTLAALGAAQQARGTAQASADLGALAAATALRQGLDPCATAREAVQRNRGSLVACAPQADGVVEVTVTRPSADVPGWLVREAMATSRAGPRPPGSVSGNP